LPIGISFFTFHAISYLVDVYRGDFKAERDPIKVLLYIAMFPQLIAGPIVRFGTVAKEIHERIVTLEKFALGLKFFIIGLGQKVLIANTLAVPVDAIYKIPIDNLDAPMAWLAGAGYALQIYFDFAGYSNMAIGLGLMIGIYFPLNFNTSACPPGSAIICISRWVEAERARTGRTSISWWSSCCAGFGTARSGHSSSGASITASS
jgi:alginate O-acetyltransferase complex protein AlgI